MKEFLDSLEALHAAAPPGIWKDDSHGSYVWAPSEKGGYFTPLEARGWGYYTGKGDGALGLSEREGIARQRATVTFVVAAHNAFPALLAAARRLPEVERDAEVWVDRANMAEVALIEAEAEVARLREALAAERERVKTLEDGLMPFARNDGRWPITAADLARAKRLVVDRVERAEATRARSALENSNG